MKIYCGDDNTANGMTVVELLVDRQISTSLFFLCVLFAFNSGCNFVLIHCYCTDLYVFACFNSIARRTRGCKIFLDNFREHLQCSNDLLLSLSVYFVQVNSFISIIKSNDILWQE